MSVRESRALKLSEEDLIPISPKRIGRSGPIIMGVPGDGRITFSTAAMNKLSPDKKIRAVRLFEARVGEKRYLVVRPARGEEEDVLILYPTGGRSPDKWPVTTMGRAMEVLNYLGIKGPCRFTGQPYSYEPPEGGERETWLVFDLSRPEPYEARADMKKVEAIRRWLEKVQSGYVVDLQSAVREINQAMDGEQVFKRPHQLASFLRANLGQFGKQVEIIQGKRLVLKVK
jgi:hypothetical protein